MKKRIIVFAAASVVLLSFTFVAGNNTETTVPTAQKITTESNPHEGFAIEDKAAW